MINVSKEDVFNFGKICLFKDYNLAEVCGQQVDDLGLIQSYNRSFSMRIVDSPNDLTLALEV